MGALCSASILLVAVVNLVPVSGLFSAGRLEALYGLALEDPNLLILMRHRAVLFGIVGGLLAVSAFHRPLRPAGFAAGLISMLSFVLLAVLVGDYSEALRRIVVVDLVASAVLVGAVVLDHRAAPSGTP